MHLLPVILCNSRKVKEYYSAVVLGKSKKYYTFATHIDTDKKILKSPNAFKKSKLVRDPIFFSLLPNFFDGLAGKICQELATLFRDAGK